MTYRRPQHVRLVRLPYLHLRGRPPKVSRRDQLQRAHWHFPQRQSFQAVSPRRSVRHGHPLELQFEQRRRRRSRVESRWRWRRWKAPRRHLRRQIIDQIQLQITSSNADEKERNGERAYLAGAARGWRPRLCVQLR